MKKRILSFVLLCAMLVSMLGAVPMLAASADEAKTEVVYDQVVTDDAYIRGNNADNRNKNFNFEDAAAGHNAPGVKVVNIKYQGGEITGNINEIISLFKVSIPSKADIESTGADKFEFRFTVFKNPNAYNCPETYKFYYIAESDMINYLSAYGAEDWTETNVKWNYGSMKWITTRYHDNMDAIQHADKKVSEIAANEVGSITIAKDEDYAEKVVSFDITEAVKALAQKGETAMTIFAYAENDVKGDDGNGTSLMIHSKETEVESARPRLVGTKTTAPEVKPDDNPTTGDIATVAFVALALSLVGAAVVVSRKRIRER